MEGVRWVRVILVVIFSFLVGLNPSYGQQKESFTSQKSRISLEHIATIKAQDVAHDVFSKSISLCKNYLMLNLDDGPAIIDYRSGKKLKINISNKRDYNLGITNFTSDCRYLVIEDRRNLMDVFKEYKYFCPALVNIYIYDVVENKNLYHLKACSESYGFSPDGKKFAITIPSAYLNKNFTALPFELIQLDFGRFVGWLDDKTIVIERKEDYKPVVYYIDNKQIREDEKLKITGGIDGIYNYKDSIVIVTSYKTKDGKYKSVYYDYKTLAKLFEYYWTDVFISKFVPDSFILFIKRAPKFILPTDAEVDDKIVAIDLKQPIKKEITVLKLKNPVVEISVSHDGEYIALLEYAPKERYDIRIFKVIRRY